MSKRWRLRAEAELMRADSQFVITTSTLLSVARSSEYVPTPSSLYRWIKDLVAGGKLQPATRGFYLNRLGHRNGDAAELAQWIRSGSVLSLSWVLEQAGVTNNFGDTYTCIIPLEPSWTTPQIKTRAVKGVGTFRFFSMKVDLVDEAAGALTDVFDLRFPYRRATPEKALLDWIYLGASHRSRLKPPPLDLSIQGLDMARLHRLSKTMGLDEEWSSWLNAWKRYQADPDVQSNDSGLFT